MNVPVPPAELPAPRSPGCHERNVLGVIAVVALHLALFAITAAISTTSGDAPRPPLRSVVLIFVSCLQAWCSLGAIWWGCSRWPSHVKSLAAIGACAAVWAILVGVLPATDLHSERAAAWGASLATQALATALATLFINRLRPSRRPAAGPHFTIMYLLIWTAVVASVLGGVRWLAEALGWTAEVLQWQYFPQLQLMGLFNSLLAVSLWTALWAWRGWMLRLIVCGSLVVSVMLIANVLLTAIFENVGAHVVDICWLYAGQAAFLVASLAPLQAAADHRCSENAATTG